MSGQFSMEPMLDMYLFETTQNLEQLETLILSSEKSSSYTADAINEIFRIMHTIKGSSAMMLFNNISVLAHSVEDLFYYIREKKPAQYDCSGLSDIVLEALDFLKVELGKIKKGDVADGEPTHLIENNKNFLNEIRESAPIDIPNKKSEIITRQQYYIKPDRTADSAKMHRYKAVITFEDGCEMENIRAYSVIHSIKEFTNDVSFFPR